MTTYLEVIGLFATLSLLSIGGGNVVLPDMHQKAVRQEHWVTDNQFADLFSISQAAPGPSILIVGMIGYAAGLQAGGVAGGVLGGLIAATAMVLPAASLAVLVSRFWQKAEQSRWRIGVEKGFPPLTVGLILASSLVMSRAADHDWKAYTLTAVCTLIFVRTKTNPLIVVGAAALIGYLGFV